MLSRVCGANYFTGCWYAYSLEYIRILLTKKAQYSSFLVSNEFFMAINDIVSDYLKKNGRPTRKELSSILNDKNRGTVDFINSIIFFEPKVSKIL